jgi:hypothetical protein
VPYSYDPDAGGLIPEGNTQLTITAIEETTSRKGDPMWIIRMQDPANREHTEWVVQTPKMIDWKFRPLWEAAGLQWPTGTAIIDEQQLVDRRVKAFITHERNPDFGTQTRIQNYMPPGAGDLPGQESFDTTPAGANSSGDEEEIPF